MFLALNLWPIKAVNNSGKTRQRLTNGHVNKQGDFTKIKLKIKNKNE